MIIPSLSKAFSVYSKNPFNFAWASLLYLLTLIVAVLAAIGLFLIYFMAASVLNLTVSLDSIHTLVALGIIAILFLFFTSGLNGALARAYYQALSKEKTTVMAFYSYALHSTPSMFGIMLVRDLLWLLIVGPFIAIYIYFLKSYPYMDALLGLYAFFMTFTIHMLFTPAFIATGAFGSSLHNSLKHTVTFLRNRHIFFIALYIVFALSWLLSFIPLVQLATLFFLYPVVYTAMMIMLEGGVKIEKEDED